MSIVPDGGFPVCIAQKGTLRADADIVIGSRLVDGKTRIAGARGLGSRLISRLIALTTGTTITDPTSGMRMYNHAMIEMFADGFDVAPEPDTVALVARKGGTVERAARPVTIHELSIAGREGEDWLLDVHCSKGTYIRTLCHDIGLALGCGGCMSALRRTEAGAFRVDDAITISEAQRLRDAGEIEQRLLPVDMLFSREKTCTASAQEEKRIRCGTEYRTELPDGLYRVYGESGAFLMLGRAEDGVMKTIKNFFEV